MEVIGDRLFIESGIRLVESTTEDFHFTEFSRAYGVNKTNEKDGEEDGVEKNSGPENLRLLSLEELHFRVIPNKPLRLIDTFHNRVTRIDACRTLNAL